MIIMGPDIKFQPRRNCARCNTELNESNTTKEHIIPNCLGGRLKPKFLLCKDCNQLFDATDSGLCNAFDFFDSFLLVKKDRRTGYRRILVKTSMGEMYLIGGQLEFVKQVIENPDGSKTIRALNPEKAWAILDGLRRKHGEAVQLRNLGRENVSDIRIPINIISPSAWRGIAKILFDATYCFNNEYQPVKNLIREILDSPWEDVSRTCPITFAPERVIENFPTELDPNKWLFYHSVIIEYRPRERCIIGIVQIYNMPYIALIESAYDGEVGCIGYFINPLTGESKKEEINEEIHMSKVELEHCIQNWLTSDTLSLFKERLGHSATTTIHHNEFERAFDSAAKETNIAEGELITEEFINNLIDRLMNSSMVRNVIHAKTFPNRVLRVLYDHLSQWLTLSQIQSNLREKNICVPIQQIESALNVLKADPERISDPFQLEQRDNNGILEVRVIYPINHS